MRDWGGGGRDGEVKEGRREQKGQGVVDDVERPQGEWALVCALRTASGAECKETG